MIETKTNLTAEAKPDLDFQAEGGKRITLPWANKFRELMIKNIFYEETCAQFLKYCYRMETEINKRWKEQHLETELSLAKADLSRIAKNLKI